MKAPPVITGANATGFVLYPASWVNEIVASATSPIGFGLASIVTDFSFGSDIVANGSTTAENGTLWPVMNIMLYPECDSDGDGIGDRLDREIDGEDDVRTTPMNTPVTVDMLANDPTAVQYGDHVVTGITQPTNGTAVLNADGTSTYTPNTGWTGIDTYTYDVVDDLGQTYTQTVTITVPPQGLDDADSTPLNTPKVLDVQGNDPTPNLTMTGATQPQAGTGSVVLNADGTVTYTPPTGFSGIATFTYTAEDAFGQTITQNVVVTVLPEGADDLYTTPLNTPVAQDVLPNDPATGLSVVSNTDPSNGTVVLNADGTGTYTPNTGFSGTDTYTYVAQDADGQQVTQTVTIIVTPLGADDSGTTPLNTPITTTVLGNDPTNNLTVSTITQPSNGTAVLNADGTVTYTPSTGFSGVDTYAYTALDPEGQPVTQTVTITVTPLGVDDADTTPLNTPIDVNVLANDPTNSLTVTSNTNPSNGTVSFTNGIATYTPNTGWTGVDTFTYTATDPAGQTVTQTVTITVTPDGEDDLRTTPFETPIVIDVLTNDPTNSLTIVSTTPPSNGTIVTNADGTITYTPNDGFSGSDTFTYTATDPSGQPVTQTVTVIVTPLGADDERTTPFETPVTVNVLENDPTLGLTVDSITQPPNGTAVLNADGTVTYTPADGFSGIDTFTYAAIDSLGQEVTQTVTITVTPVGADDADTTPFETPVTVNVLANDPTDSLTVTSITQPPAGTGTAVLNADGTVTYTPADGFSGTVTFTYTAEDEEGQEVTQTVTILVTPLGQDDSDTTPLNTPVVVDVLGNDPTDDLTVTSVTQPENGTVTLVDGVVTYTPNTGFSGTDTFTYTAEDESGQPVTQTVTILVTPVGTDDSDTTPINTPVTVNVLENDPTNDLTVTSVTQPTNGTVVLNPDGTVTYTPNDGWTGTDVFTYTATDPEGQPVTQTVTIVVAPEGADDSDITPMDTPVTVDVLTNDPTDNLTLVSTTQPPNGSVEIVDGQIVYTPNPGFTGTDVFTYTATDPEGQEITQTVTIVVTPVGADDSETTPFETPVTIDVTNNDPTKTLVVQTVTQPTHGTVVLNEDGTVTYTPNDGFSGTDTFTYTATDPEGQPVTQTVTILVTPKGEDDSATTPPNTPVTIDVLDNDPTDNLTVISVTQPTNGTVVLNEDGTVTYTPNPGFSGTDTFTYTARDESGQLVTQTVTVTVPPVPVDPTDPVDPPVIPGVTPPKPGEIAYTGGDIAPVIGGALAGGAALLAGLWLMVRRRRNGGAEA